MSDDFDTRLWEMRNGSVMADIVRKTLREHREHLGPDDHGRMHTCSCGHWQPGRPWAHHIIDVLEGAGLDLGGVA